MRIGILGGTFNPVHNGHLRLAVEAGEALGLDCVLLTPCASPPHKSGNGLLPFDLRVALLREAVRGVPMLAVNTLEGELVGPSYTWVSLTEWHRRQGAEFRADESVAPERRPFFMMGAESFAALDSWRRGLELPKLAHLVMVPRGGDELALFRESIRRFWPGSLPESGGADEVAFQRERQGGECDAEGAQFQRETAALAGIVAGGACSFLPVPRLDISSTFVRERWREGRSLAGLLPEGVLARMERERAVLDAVWN